MKLAIPVYNDSVSNVLDFARRLLLIEIEDGKETSRIEVELAGNTLLQRAERLKTLEVDVLICGAISRILANMVMQTRIEILPFVTGDVESVLNAYMAGNLIRPRFRMPGCWFGKQKGFGRRQGCRWRGGRS